MSTFLMKFNNSDEFDINKKIPNVVYLGGDSTPEFKNDYNSYDRRDGSIFSSSKIDRVIFTANFYLKAKDYISQKLLRHELYQLFFGDRELIRIRTNIDFQKVMYVRPKSFEIKNHSNGINDSIFSIDLEIPGGYKYSMSRSDAISIDDISFGMNFKLDEKPEFTHSEMSFRIYNPSDISIDPYYQRHDLIIRIKSQGPYYSISNKTNGTEYTYNKELKETDSLILTGLTTILNNNADSINSDFGYIKLEKGWNDIVISGAISHTTTFSFPFLYID